MDNHHFELENSLKMAMLNSYVELPEGRLESNGFNFFLALPHPSTVHHPPTEGDYISNSCIAPSTIE